SVVRLQEVVLLQHPRRESVAGGPLDRDTGRPARLPWCLTAGQELSANSCRAQLRTRPPERGRQSDGRLVAIELDDDVCPFLTEECVPIALTELDAVAPGVGGRATV